MADSFCGFVSKQRLFMSWRSVQISTYEGREGDQKEVFLKMSAFESFYDSQIILASHPTETIFVFGFFSHRRGSPANLQC